VQRAAALIAELVKAGLFDRRDDGSFEPHNWCGRQFKSDVTDPTNATSQKRYRDTHRNGSNTVTETVTDTVTVTPPRDREQRTDTEAEKKHSRARALDDGWPDDFREVFWNDYARKAEKALAIRKLEAVRKSGKVTFEALISAVRRYAGACIHIETKFQKHPATWLNAGCWDDDAAALKRLVAIPVRGGSQGFENLFQPERPTDDAAPRAEFDIDLKANTAA
jgi:hypothetical protein